jgi:hypothetical protein
LYTTRSNIPPNNDDDDIQEYEASGWRKRQVAMDKEYNYERDMRNRTIEEVAREIEKMKVFGKDTIDSFTVYIRGLKR